MYRALLIPEELQLKKGTHHLVLINHSGIAQPTRALQKCKLRRVILARLSYWRHSTTQTRAKEAETEVKQVCAEKEHILKLFFRQASQLFSYKELFIIRLRTMISQSPLYSRLPFHGCLIKAKNCGRICKRLQRVNDASKANQEMTCQSILLRWDWVS